MKNTLVISGHTDLSASVANKTILETIAQRLPQAEIVRLDSLYPDFKINAQAEQQRLLKADVIVLQFPVFWYSAPSLLERWMEETFRHGFSHGSTGDKLKGKKLVLSFTTGAPAEMYSHEGPMGYTIDEFLPCYKATCKLCGMEFAGYVFTGWSGTDLVGEDNLTVTIPAGSIGDRRYTAHWEFDPTIIAALNPTPNVDFLDVSRTDWFYYDVRYVCENGLMNGTSRNRFSPYGTATRGMLVTILYRMENEPRCFGSAAFSDVKPGAYYEKAVVWASQNNIVSGYTDGTFRPDAPVTREQLASILYRYTLYRGQDVSAGETTSLTGYGDAQAVSSYALPAMRWACGTGILQGANGKLNPSGLATRAQLAAMLHRYLTK